MLKLSSAKDMKKNTLIHFESLLEVTKSTMQVKPSLQMLTLTKPNASPTVLSAPNFLNSQTWTPSTFTLTPIWMSMNTCGYHDGFTPKISLMKIRLSTYLLTTGYLSKFAKACMASHNQDELAISRSSKISNSTANPAQVSHQASSNMKNEILCLVQLLMTLEQNIQPKMMR